MLTKKTRLVILMVGALLMVSGITPGSSALARDLSPVRPGVAPRDTAGASQAAQQALPHSSMPAGAGPVGSRFMIADQPVDTDFSTVAYNSQNQEYLVVWHNDRPANDDIYGQRVSKNGTLIGPWFSIVAGAGAERYYPHVAYNSKHNEYLVVWEVGMAAIRAQRVSATGVLIGSVATLMVTAAGDEVYFPGVAYGSGSDQYLVVFVTETAAGNSTIGLVSCAYDVFICFNNSVAPLSATWHYVPDVAYNPRRDEFLVVWREFTTSGATAKHIYGRRVSLASGLNVVGSVIQISNMSNNEDDPVVAVVPRSPDGQYLVAWDVFDTVGMDDEVWAQRLAGDGTLEGAPLPVATTPDDEVVGGIAGNANTGQYAIMWARRNSTFTQSNIQGREVRTDGSFVGGARDLMPAPPGMVGTSTPENPSIAAGPGGDFLVTFDDPVSSIRKVFGILWGNRLYLPLVLR